MKMTNKEWNMGIDFLKNAEEGQWVEHNNRRVEIVSMIAGKFMLLDKSGFAGVVDEEWRAMEFLRSGKLLISKF